MAKRLQVDPGFHKSDQNSAMDLQISVEFVPAHASIQVRVMHLVLGRRKLICPLENSVAVDTWYKGSTIAVGTVQRRHWLCYSESLHRSAHFRRVHVHKAETRAGQMTGRTQCGVGLAQPLVRGGRSKPRKKTAARGA